MRFKRTIVTKTRPPKIIAPHTIKDGLKNYILGESPKVQRPYYLRPFPNSSDVIEEKFRS